MSDPSAARDKGFQDTIDHAIRLHQKARILDQQIRDSLAVAGSMAGDLGCHLSDPLILVDAILALRALGVPGRAAVSSGASPYWIKRFSTWKVGSIHVMRREEGLPWPGQNLPCVYLLADAGGEIIYIGKTTNLRARMKAHTGKPWATTTVRFCVSEAAALSLEGDLIFQHQPRLNTQDRKHRRYVRVPSV